MQKLSAVAVLTLSALWLPAWGQEQATRQAKIPPGCTTAPDPADGMDIGDWILRNCPDSPITKRALAERAEYEKQPHFVPPFQDRVIYNSEQRPELCKQVDAPPADHKLTWDETRERANCVGEVVYGKRMYPTWENIQSAIAAVKANTEARKQWAKEHPPKVDDSYERTHYDENGNYRDKTEEAKAVESWRELHSSGRCAAAAQRVVKEYDEMTTGCVAKSITPQCRQFHLDESTVGICSVSPAESHHGPKQRANAKNPMPYAVAMAQEKRQPDSAKLAH